LIFDNIWLIIEYVVEWEEVYWYMNGWYVYLMWGIRECVIIIMMMIESDMSVVYNLGM
jgi:hypothetical protein